MWGTGKKEKKSMQPRKSINLKRNRLSKKKTVPFFP